jgi:hypothetical protein
MNFNINIHPLRNNIEMISLDIPYDSKEIVSALEKENWFASSIQHRNILIDPTDEILKELKEFISSDKIKEKIIDAFYSDFPNIENVWNGWSKKQMIERTVWDGVFVKDEPGFSMSRHVDTRTNVATGIIYLNDKADARRTTIFYTDKEGKDKLEIDNQFAKGVISINDIDTWHEVHNKTSENRYIIVVVLLLLIDFYDAEKHKNLFYPPPKINL